MQLLPDNPGDWSWSKLALYAAFATIGGALGHIMRSLSKNQKISIGRAAIEGLSAGFVGTLFMLLCNALSLGEAWTGVIVGVSGWLGASASIGILEKAIRKKLGIEEDPNVPEA